jgi:uncharacterized alkaline shock family protein YloU
MEKTDILSMNKEELTSYIVSLGEPAYRATQVWGWLMKGADIADMIGKKTWGKGIKITISDDNALSVDCNVNIGYGQSVVSVAKSVQDAVTGALESATGVNVSAVNINVCGIIRQ